MPESFKFYKTASPVPCKSYVATITLDWNLDDVNAVENIFKFEKILHFIQQFVCVAQACFTLEFYDVNTCVSKMMIPCLLPFNTPYFSKTCISPYILWIFSKSSVILPNINRYSQPPTCFSNTIWQALFE